MSFAKVFLIYTLVTLSQAAEEEVKKEAIEEEPLFSTLDIIVLGLAGEKILLM